MARRRHRVGVSAVRVSRASAPAHRADRGLAGQHRPRCSSLGVREAEEAGMSVYKVTELIGTSTVSWEDAAAEAVRRAQHTIHDVRVAKVVEQDMALDEERSEEHTSELQSR